MEETLWLKEKKGKIGGSEISAVLGLNPYKTRYQIWLDKTGRSPPIEENKYMRAGKLMEPAIVAFWEQETGFKVEINSADNELYNHPEYTFIGGTPDRIYYNGDQKCILECKNTRIPIDPDNIPKHWWCQLQYYMGLTQSVRGEIAWLYQGVDFFHIPFNFSSVFWEYAIQQAKNFWINHIEKDIPPDPEGIDIDTIFNTHFIGKSVIAASETVETITRIKTIREEKEILLKEEINLLRQLKMIMKDSEFLMNENNEVIATWKSNKANKRIFLIK